MDICSATSYPFVFPSRSKCAPLDILKCIVTTLRNRYNKVTFIRVDEYGALARSYEFIKTCHNMNIIVHTTGGDSYYRNSKSESLNKTIDNITRALLLKPSNKKEPWCFPYQYAIWISLWNENILRGDVSWFLWHGTRPPYKYIKIWGVRVYIINGHAKNNNLDDRSHRGYFMGYADTTVVIVYWKPDQPFIIHRAHHVWFDQYNSLLSIR